MYSRKTSAQCNRRFIFSSSLMQERNAVPTSGALVDNRISASIGSAIRIVDCAWGAIGA